MKILVVADEEEKSLWDYYTPEKTAGVDLIISCGDLSAEYLEFLVTMTNCPLVYVRGNHDRDYDRRPPEGCNNIENKIYDFQGLRILGLGGSMRYKEGSDMYTESEMRARISRMNRSIVLRNGFDVLVTHAPARGYGDMSDLPHRGFECFNTLLMKWKPKYMLHGHVHRSYGAANFEREQMHESGTRIINACGSCLLNIADDEHPGRGRTGSALYDLYISLQEKRKKY